MSVGEQAIKISIHALREEGDAAALGFDVVEKGISIHALREEGDRSGRHSILHARAISIHALREEGDMHSTHGTGRAFPFLSTPSARRATGQRKQAQ